MQDKAATILAVDDSVATLEVISRNLTAAGYVVHACGSVEEAGAFLDETPVDLIITDYKMPRSSGLELIKYVRDNFRDTEIMMITGYPSISGAVEAMRDGAGEYLAKPFTGEELLAVVRRILEKQARRRAAHAENQELSAFGIIGNCPEMQAVYALIRKAAQTSANVFISGDSGTGKELVARAVHYNSDRRASAFVPVNCSAIPDSLLESELFGHVKGAFTGAKDSRAGFFEIANGGTIFLDEIGDASPSLQAKLLRVMQSKEFCMVGSSRTRTVDTRIIAATHKDLKRLVEQGLFREDLFYRIHVVEIHLPSLAERGDDILMLANHFLRKFAEDMNRETSRMTDEVLDALSHYSWPGNVRELENLLQRLVIVGDDPVIDITDLPESMRFSISRSRHGNKTLAEVEAEHIRAILARTGDNKTRAAEILGIDRKTLREKLKRLGLG
ncbi:MAG: sigma-54 dependent transcriptional regulator [Desulfomicrobium sp.]|nr:sigma-54 dependent transcriptional regulator [Pseudomonadota bacterium]MBV1711619.1 sigma-54 dependent transcriptional regulator [Desulfomicrobium sp.]MBU4569683.1 sigma-54 dependent transcriptional regulator [Pseudomonadota bacterium]MBU4595403.1 sigma-54 dependent transcriptional regulator [Pseudomonadota bacterium]MBV1718694.1 sigma-54 dependent transcriptional regulator [Desulfomicrobium sp.]